MSRIKQIKDCRNLTIRYGYVESPLGRLFAGATDDGICYLGFDEPDTYRNMADRYDGANFIEGLSDNELRQIDDYMRGNDSSATFHLLGTEFQLRVWQALLDIPFASLSSYAEIARKAGNPKAVRAAGSAIGRNPVTLLIPCHRVLRSDGSMGGYFWGIETKRRILEWERALK